MTSTLFDRAEKSLSLPDRAAVSAGRSPGVRGTDPARAQSRRRDTSERQRESVGRMEFPPLLPHCVCQAP